MSPSRTRQDLSHLSNFTGKKENRLAMEVMQRKTMVKLLFLQHLGKCPSEQAPVQTVRPTVIGVQLGLDEFPFRHLHPERTSGQREETKHALHTAGTVGCKAGCAPEL